MIMFLDFFILKRLLDEGDLSKVKQGFYELADEVLNAVMRSNE